MAIITTDIKFFHSGGAGNTLATASLGGAKSTTAVTDDTLNNIFDKVIGDEADTGDTEYRGIYFENDHATLTLETTVVWIETQTPSTNDAIAIALAGEGIDGTMETIANESTAPSGETFTAPANKAAGLLSSDLTAQQFHGLWIRRVVDASAAAYDTNSFVIQVEGDTAA
jgi:hypothetical protein